MIHHCVILTNSEINELSTYQLPNTVGLAHFLSCKYNASLINLENGKSSDAMHTFLAPGLNIKLLLAGFPLF